MNKVTTAIAASGIAIASVAVGMVLQAALYDLPQRESNITAEPERKPVNPNALPGVEAPTNRTDRNGMLMPWCKKCHNRITNTNRAKRKMTNKEDE